MSSKECWLSVQPAPPLQSRLQLQGWCWRSWLSPTPLMMRCNLMHARAVFWPIPLRLYATRNLQGSAGFQSMHALQHRWVAHCPEEHIWMLLVRFCACQSQCVLVGWALRLAMCRAILTTGATCRQLEQVDCCCAHAEQHPHTDRQEAVAGSCDGLMLLWLLKA